MAVNIGPRIGIEGEREYRKAVNELIAQQKTFTSEMRATESEFDDNASAMDRVRKKAALLTKAIENQEKTVAKLEEGLAAAEKNYDSNSTQVQKWRQAVNNAKTELNRMNTELRNLPSRMSLVGQKMQGVGEAMEKVGTSMTKAISAPLAGFSVASAKLAMDAETSFAKVTTIIDQTAVSYDELTQGVIAASNDTGVAITDFNEALYSSISAGVESGKAIEFTTDMVKLAKGGFTDTSKAVDVVTTVLNAYGLSADEASSISDKLITTQNLGKTTVDELAGALGRVIPTAKASNVNFDALSASMAILTKRGISTNEATTYLNAMLGELSKSGSTVDEILREKTGKSFAELQAAGVPLNEVLQILSEAAQEGEKSLADLFSQQNAGKAALTILSDGGAEFAEILGQMATSAGATEKAFTTMSQTSGEKFNKALNKAKNSAVLLGGQLLDTATPAVEALGNAAQKAGDWFAHLDEKEKTQLTRGLAIAMGIGPGITAVGKLTTKVGDAVTAIGNFKDKVPGLSSVAGVAGPIAIAAGALVALKIGMDKAEAAVIASNEALKATVEGSQSAADTLNAAVEKVNSVIADTEATVNGINGKAGNAHALVAELYELSSQSDLTAEAQSRMKTIVDELNAMYPELSLSIDSTTGSLSMGKEELDAYIETAKKMALLEAYTNAGKDALQAVVEAEAALYTARQQQAKNDAYIAELESNIAKAREDMPEGFEAQGYSTKEIAEWEVQLGHAKEAQEGLNKAVADAEAPVQAAREAYEYYGNQQETLEGELKDSTAEQDSNTKSTKENTEATTENTEATEANTDADEENAEATKEQSTALRDFVTAVGNATTSVLKDTLSASRAWDELYESTLSSIQGQMGLFDEWSHTTELTAQDILANMDSQIAGIQNYTDNMNYLIEQAMASNDPLAKEFVKALDAMGIAAAGEVDVITTALKDGTLSWNDVLSRFGTETGAQKNLAEISTFVKNDFVPKNRKVFEALTKSIQKNFDNSKLFSGFTKNSGTALSNLTSTFFKGLPKVSSEISTQLSKGSKEGATQINNNVTTGMSSMFSVVGSFAQKASANISLNLSNGSKNGANAVILNSSNAASSMEKSLTTGAQNSKSAITSNAQSGATSMEKSLTTGAKNASSAVTSNAQAGASAMESRYTTGATKSGEIVAIRIKKGSSDAKDGVISNTETAMTKLEQRSLQAATKAASDLDNKVGKLKMSPEVTEVKHTTAMNAATNALKVAFTNIPASMGALLNAPARGQNAQEAVKQALTNVPGTMGALQNVGARAQTAKGTVENTLSNMKGVLGSIGNVASAASHAVSTGNSRLRFTGHLSEITGAANAAASAKANAQAWLNGHPATLPVYSKTMNTIHPYANGGFITQEQIATVGEHNDPEVIIPLSTSKRARALSLFEQAGEILGVKAPDVKVKEQKVPNVRVPQPEPAPLIDYNALYSAVATAARQGLQSANIKVYWNGREAGRIMRDMGVQFA